MASDGLPPEEARDRLQFIRALTEHRDWVVADRTPPPPLAGFERGRQFGRSSKDVHLERSLTHIQASTLEFAQKPQSQ